MISPQTGANGSLPRSIRRFNVRIDIGKMSPEDGAIWADSTIIDGDIASKGARDEKIELWIVKSKNSRGAIAKAERENKNCGVKGVKVSSVEERL